MGNAMTKAVKHDSGKAATGAKRDRAHLRKLWAEHNATLDASSTGVKYDDGKPRTDLLPPDALLGTSAVFAYGARKYSANNWRGGIKLSRLIGALLRHVFAFMAGQDLDPESGLPHLDHALCSLMMLRSTWASRKDMDDRWKAAP